MHFHAYVLYIQYIFIYLNYFWDFFECFFLSPHSLVYIYVSWHWNVCLLCLGTLFISGHLLLLIPPPLLFSSMMSKPERTSWRTSLDEAFIRNTKSFCRTSSTLIYPLSFTVGAGSHCLCDVSVTSPSMLILEFYSNMHGLDSSIPFFITHVRGMRIIVTPNIVSEVLHVSMVEHLDYPSCECLRTVSKDEMISTFCEHPVVWGDR